MRSALLIACFGLMLPGCFISHTKEKEVSKSPTVSGRACGSHVCAADEDCVQTPSGSFHCE